MDLLMSLMEAVKDSAAENKEMSYEDLASCLMSILLGVALKHDIPEDLLREYCDKYISHAYEIYSQVSNNSNLH